MGDFTHKDKSDTVKKIRYSKKLYHATLQSISDAIFVIDPSTRTVVLCNPASEKIFGYKHDEIIGRNTEFLHVNKEMYEEFGRRLFPALDKDGVFNTEFKMKRKDGTIFFTENTVTEIVDDSGRRTGVVRVVKDITRNKTAEKLLKESEERYKSIFNNNKVIMLLIDPETANIVDANGTACSFYGYTKDRLTSMKISDINILSREEVFQEMENAKSERRNYFIFRHRLANGEIRDVEIYSGPVKINGKVNLISIIHDITERKNAEESFKYRVMMEKLVSAVSTSFANINNEDFDDKINKALKMIGEFAGVDRSYLFLYSEDKTTMDNTHEWCAEGIEPQITKLKGLPIDVFPWWNERINRLESIHIPKVAGLPAEAAKEKEILQMQSIQSLVAVPLTSGNMPVGFLGFDSVRALKIWTDEDIRMLKLVGEIIINAIERRQAEESIKVLRGFIPICASCKKIRNDKGYWEQLEAYITEHSDAQFSHGICPECAKKLYPDLYSEE